LNVYPKFFHTAASRKMKLLKMMQKAELHLHITNIGVFLKIATDCNFFSKKGTFICKQDFHHA